MKKYWKLILSAFCLIGGLGNIGKNVGGVLTGVVLAAAFFAWWYVPQKKEKTSFETADAKKNYTHDEMVQIVRLMISADEPHLVQDIQRKFKVGYNEAARILNEADGRAYYNVAGVTFKNDDGSSRQRTLRAYYYQDPPFESGTATVSLIPHQYDGNPAYFVAIDGHIVGNVERDAVEEVTAKYDLIKNISISVNEFFDEENKRKYSAKIYVKYDA